MIRTHVERMNKDAHLLFNQQNAKNQRNYNNNQGNTEQNANFEQYLLQLNNPDEIPLKDHPYVKNQQYKFRSDISK